MGRRIGYNSVQGTMKKYSRRDFLNLLRAALSVSILGGLGGLTYGFSLEPEWFEVVRVQLKLSRLPRAFSGFKMVQISDLHMGGWMNAERLQVVVDLVQAQRPDLVAITGDFFEGHGWDSSDQAAAADLTRILSPLAHTTPTFAVLGNHDHWTSTEATRAMLSASGIVELNNDVHALTREEQSLHLCGVDDIWEGRQDLDQVLSKLPEDGAAILLAHEPDFADESAAVRRFDLQLSGHSHGGQIVVPLLGPPVLPWLAQKYPSGLYELDGMYQYTNRGVGMIYPAVRVNCRPEITLFDLEAA